MSPIKVKAFDFVNGFKEDQKYFQDWSLFYRLSCCGFKGKYIPEFIFTTSYPKEENISGSKGLTLSQKSEKFRKKHGIDDKTIVTTTFAAPLQAIQRAKMLNSDYAGPPKEGGRRMVQPINYYFG